MIGLAINAKPLLPNGKWRQLTEKGIGDRQEVPVCNGCSEFGLDQIAKEMAAKPHLAFTRQRQVITG